ncbi:MAG: phage holin family protein [Propionibacteriaceae bacterium]|jgi:putative membrane protein|nr:phage holin family protein [Propionibacteriaceae bacterium]
MLVRLVINMLALAAAAYLVPGITLTGEDDLAKILTLLLVAVIFGVINTIVKPLFTVLSLPLVILTLGIGLLVINGLMLWLTSWGAGLFNLGWHVDGFWAALFGSIVISLVSLILNAVATRLEK